MRVKTLQRTCVPPTRSLLKSMTSLREPALGECHENNIRIFSCGEAMLKHVDLGSLVGVLPSIPPLLGIYTWNLCIHGSIACVR